MKKGVFIEIGLSRDVTGKVDNIHSNLTPQLKFNDLFNHFFQFHDFVQLKFNDLFN